jgi:pyruvate/2-oxoglutarate dehydrogenase complex dihydrolipoamide dehydrogenase (E3) component
MQDADNSTVVAMEDPAEAERLARVKPTGWTNPEPASKYDLVVIGGGTAGLVCAMGAAGLGARVALVERQWLGGDCLNTGCVPSKALIRSARAVGEIRRADSLGIAATATVDFGKVMARLRSRRATIAANDSAARLTQAGVHVFFGDGRFLDRRSVSVAGAVLTFGRAVVATGGRAVAPPIPGLDEIPYLTNESIFEITILPRRLLVLGAGAAGCELAQAFARLGSVVTVVDQSDQLLPRESAKASTIVRRRLEGEGVRFELGVRVERAESAGGEVALVVSGEGRRDGAHRVAGDVLLVAAGRAPNIESLALDAAGVQVDGRGVVVNDRLQTTNPRVFASGDVCSTYKFTHAADAMSRLVVQNALFFGRRRASALTIPWVTFTDPEVAHVGTTHVDVARSGGRLSTITVDLGDVDRAVVDDDVDGFVQVHHERGLIRGCTIVASHAGEMIAEAVFAVTHGHTLPDLSATVHPYPTQSEALRKAGDAYRRQALTPGAKRWLSRYFAWTR